ncbi:MAG: hypothetical protein KC613_20540, partial [Myxococcales bacterium]|nr:hypothetical protein [Myxococcales bacterium]
DLSADGQVACATCHQPEHGFGDPRPTSPGAFDRPGSLHAPGLLNVAFQRVWMWNGRVDHLWSQPIQALEHPAEHDFTRVELAHRIAGPYRPYYESVFGPLPDLGDLPPRAKPGDDAWAALSAAQRDAIDRVAANVGKAIEAYERKLLCTDTRLDRYLRGEGELTALELQGAAQFLDRDQGDCARCHGGATLSDGAFHNLGLERADSDELGRPAGLQALVDDPFNGEGDYSDDPTAGRQRIEAMVLAEAPLGGFRTVPLRGVAQRAVFGHRGDTDRLRTWITTVYRRRGRRGRGDGDLLGQRSSLIRDPGNPTALVAFLQTLSCPPLPEALTRAPTATELAEAMAWDAAATVEGQP